MAGYIYCLTNDCMPGVVKVGMTNSLHRTPEMRAKELYTTGVPMPFEVAIKKRVHNPNNKEKQLHKLLSKYTERINSSREFFRTTPSIVLEFFNLIDEYRYDSEDSDEEQEAIVQISITQTCDEYWINFQKYKQQLMDWKEEFDKKQDGSHKERMPSTLAEGPEGKAARLRQRVRNRQATPTCWPQHDDSVELVEFKERMISQVVGGDWFVSN